MNAPLDLWLPNEFLDRHLLDYRRSVVPRRIIFSLPAVFEDAMPGCLPVVECDDDAKITALLVHSEDSTEKSVGLSRVSRCAPTSRTATASDASRTSPLSCGR